MAASGTRAQGKAAGVKAWVKKKTAASKRVNPKAKKSK